MRDIIEYEKQKKYKLKLERENNKVAVTDIEKSGSVKEAVFRAIELIGEKERRVFTDNSTVAIKPNLTSDKASWRAGTTTNPAVVEAVIEYLNDNYENLKIYIIETDSDGTINRAFKRLGYEEMASKFDNVYLKNLEEDPQIKLITPDKSKVRCFSLSEFLLDIDHYIVIGNLKRHVHERVTCIWKNAWGVPAGRFVRLLYHPFLNQALYTLNNLFYPDLCIIDGIIGMEGAGPLEGFPVRVNKIAAGFDAIYTDMFAAQIMGDKPKQIPSIKYAMKKMKRKVKKLEILGDEWEAINFQYIPGKARFFYRLGFFFRRMGMHIENLGFLMAFAGFAFRIGTLNQFAGGGMQSLGSTWNMAMDFWRRLDVSERTNG